MHTLMLTRTHYLTLAPFLRGARSFFVYIKKSNAHASLYNAVSCIAVLYG